MSERGQDDLEDFNVWPAFVDLLAATSLLFVTLVALFVFIAYERQKVGDAEAAGLRTELDRLVTALRTSVADTVYTVESDSQFVTLRIQEQATFPHGQYEWHTLRESGKLALEEIGRVLSDTSISRLYREVRVVGHSDSIAYVTPSFSNWELSASRAAVVARYLVDQVSVDPCKISASGVGPYFPRADLPSDLSPAARREQNRRIEIEIIPARAAGRFDRAACDSFGDGSNPESSGL